MTRAIGMIAAHVALASLAAPATPVWANAGDTLPRVTAIPGKPLLMLGRYDIDALGYSTEEYFVSGMATSYRLKDGPSSDGVWQAETGAPAPYTTRYVVIRPRDVRKFNGTVVVEWLNVSAGADGASDWTMLHRELTRSGYAYVGVSAQQVGVQGGQSQNITNMNLKHADPARYGRLSHPGDAWSYDVFSQAGLLLRQANGGGLLQGLRPQRVIGLGESQSALFLTTYVDAVDPLAHAYDGFMLNSRIGTAAPLDGIQHWGGPEPMPAVVKLRPDLRVPVLTVLTETDVVMTRRPGYFAARQPDSGNFRLWEIAGAAHADAYAYRVGHIDSGTARLDDLAAGYAPTTMSPAGPLGRPVNYGYQHHYVLKAGLASLDRWLRTGRAPARVARLEATAPRRIGEAPSLLRDGNGIALGGVRTPWVDVPTAVMSGTGNTGGVLADLSGVSDPFNAARIKALYPGGKGKYLEMFAKALSRAIGQGFILAADREEILALAAAGWRD